VCCCGSFGTCRRGLIQLILSESRLSEFREWRFGDDSCRLRVSSQMRIDFRRDSTFDAAIVGWNGSRRRRAARRRDVAPA